MLHSTSLHPILATSQLGAAARAGAQWGQGTAAMLLVPPGGQSRIRRAHPVPPALGWPTQTLPMDLCAAIQENGYTR